MPGTVAEFLEEDVPLVLIDISCRSMVTVQSILVMVAVSKEAR